MSTPISASLTPPEKHRLLARALETLGLDAWLEPPEDEHLNEYLPDPKKRITWLTGFSGESAPALTTPNTTFLFVDGRFHLQVDDEVDASVVTAVKLSDAQTEQSLPKTLIRLAQEKPGLKVGYHPFVMTPGRLESLQKATAEVQITWTPITPHALDTLWTDPPPQKDAPIYLLDEAMTGQSTAQKLANLRKELKNLGTQGIPITKLDEVAWLFNLRGADIDYNPVVEAYGLVTEDSATLFVRPSVVAPSLMAQLAESGVTVKPYGAYPQALSQWVQASQPTVLIDKSALTLGTLQLVEAEGGTPVYAITPIAMAKALKNPVELCGMREANRLASLALIQHFAWLDAAFDQGLTPSEVDLRDHIESCYQALPGFKDLSFPTIAGVGTNSAIIHYSHANPQQILQPGMFYLLDSGCQIWGGTTDTTRTTVYGSPSADQIEAYTAVLKAHIACGSAQFPKGTPGRHLDSVCRAPLYALGHECPHGIGHGVGAFLNVHEGPTRISKLATLPLSVGMVTSVEPGVYYAGWGGIRLENLYEVVTQDSHPQTPDITWLGLSSLTYVPFVRKLIDPTQLSPQERTWLNGYHQAILQQFVRDTRLIPEAQTWLQTQCAPF